ncbi:MAG TPA: hypothetical protein PKC91_01615 [Ignavibacteria bacterium]|nr:hypothetical protein [Ignavibacteria bacterium]
MNKENFLRNKKYLAVFLVFITMVTVIFFIFRPKILMNENISKKNEQGEGKVRLEISAEFDEYIIDQLIWIKVTVINNSDDNYYLTYPLRRLFVKFDETYPSGNKNIENLPADSSMQSDSLLLKPGSTFEKVIQLNREPEKFYGEKKKETGIYKISARYQDIKSNEINFKVSEPAGIDKELYDETYLKLFKDDIPVYERNTKLGELLKKYPGTRYSPQLYKKYFEESNYTKDYNNNSDDINYFFESNYDTYGADLILDVGNVNFEKLLSKYRDSKTGYMIRQRRKEILTLK